MEELFIICYIILLSYLNVHGDSFNTIVPLNIEQNSTLKADLRYGFQKTSECANFEKSFLCIQKCLDLKFDVAYTDKKCVCTCYTKKEKAKYTLASNTTGTKWKLGAPTTSLPRWAQTKATKEISTKKQEFIDLSDNYEPTNSTNSKTTATNSSAVHPKGSESKHHANLVLSGNIHDSNTKATDLAIVNKPDTNAASESSGPASIPSDGPAKPTGAAETAGIASEAAVANTDAAVANTDAAVANTDAAVPNTAAAESATVAKADSTNAAPTQGNEATTVAA